MAKEKEETAITLIDLGLSDGLNETQSKALDDLKTFIKVHDLKIPEIEVEDENSKFTLNEATLLRFLAARDFVAKEAGNFLKAHLDWRLITMPSLLTKETVLPSLVNSGIYRLMGKSKEGHSIIQFQLKLLDPYAQELSHYTKYCVYVLEQAMKQATDKTKCIWIFDLEGWGVTTHGTPRGTDFTKEVLVTAQNHYPERLHMALIVNSPWLFSTAWSVIAGWLDKKTQQKVKFLKSRKDLHQWIDKEKLPASYYGSHPGYPPTME